MIKYLTDTDTLIILECWHQDRCILTAKIAISNNHAHWSDKFHGIMSKDILKTMKKDFDEFLEYIKTKDINSISIIVQEKDILQGETLRKIFKFPKYESYFVSTRKL